MIKIGVSDIIATIALILSLILTFLEVKRRIQKIHVEVMSVTVIDATGNTVYLLLDLAIVNPSTVAKTIYLLDIQPIDKYKITEVEGEQDFSQSIVTFRPLGDRGRAVQVRLEDVPTFPLDIEPLHSRTTFVALTLSPVSPPKKTVSKPIPKKPFGYILALDYLGRQLAKNQLTGPL